MAAANAAKPSGPGLCAALRRKGGTLPITLSAQAVESSPRVARWRPGGNQSVTKVLGSTADATNELSE